METNKIVNKLVELGGNEWHKFTDSGNEYHRVYFDVEILATIAGYEWSTYNTGNISSASHNGAGISNSEMKRVFGSMCGDKFYYDVLTDEFKTKSGYSHDVCSQAASILRQAINELTVLS